jgi:hypothetical protein
MEGKNKFEVDVNLRLAFTPEQFSGKFKLLYKKILFKI